jgi:hypothetical protein
MDGEYEQAMDGPDRHIDLNWVEGVIAEIDARARECQDGQVINLMGMAREGVAYARMAVMPKEAIDSPELRDEIGRRLHIWQVGLVERMRELDRVRVAAHILSLAITKMVESTAEGVEVSEIRMVAHHLTLLAESLVKRGPG